MVASPTRYRSTTTQCDFVFAAGNASLLDLCDIDNDQVGCQQLCVLVPGGRKQCACAVGFRLAADQHSCISGMRVYGSIVVSVSVCLSVCAFSCPADVSSARALSVVSFLVNDWGGYFLEGVVSKYVV